MASDITLDGACAGMSEADNETMEYKDLVERYKVKKTTDDCYTPPHVYEAVVEWVLTNYGIDRKRTVVRPFFPGGDYEHFDYPEGCVVIDNPPFSILSKIVKFYTQMKIDFFLFAPTLTCFNAGRDRCNYVITDVTFTYENGARIRTSFVTNMGEYAILSLPDLDALLTRCEEQTIGRPVRKLMSIEYPPEIATTSNISAMVRHGLPYKVKKGGCAYISHVGCERQSIFGGGMILTKEAVAQIVEEPSRIKKTITLSPEDRARQEAIGKSAETLIEQTEFELV